MPVVFSFYTASPAEVVELDTTPVGGVLVKIEDHCAEGLSELLLQYQDSPYIKGVLCSLLNAVQRLEDDLYAVYAAFDLETATGHALDILGAIVVEPRAGREDDEYRLAVRTRIIVNQSNGQIEDLHKVVTVWFGDLLDASHIVEMYPRSLMVSPKGITPNPIAFGRMLLEAAPGGVNTKVVYQVANNHFRFTSGHPTTAVGRGFRSEHSADPGHPLTGMVG